MPSVAGEHAPCFLRLGMALETLICYAKEMSDTVIYWVIFFFEFFDEETNQCHY